MIATAQIQTSLSAPTYMPLSTEQYELLKLAYAMDSFMLDDSKDWFYWSEFTIDNAYTALQDGLSRLIIEEDMKNSLLNLKFGQCSDLAFGILAYAQLARSEVNTDLIRSCLSVLETRNLASDPELDDCTIDHEQLRKYEETYQLLPHMKSVLLLIKDIRMYA